VTLSEIENCVAGGFDIRRMNLSPISTTPCALDATRSLSACG
jgi:hypothetical protein